MHIDVENAGSTYFLFPSDSVGTGTNKEWFSYFSLEKAKSKSKDHCYS